MRCILVSLIIDETGKVWSTGSNDNGKLGREPPAAGYPSGLPAGGSTEDWGVIPHPSGTGNITAGAIFAVKDRGLIVESNCTVWVWGAYESTLGVRDVPEELIYNIDAIEYEDWIVVPKRAITDQVWPRDPIPGTTIDVTTSNEHGYSCAILNSSGEIWGNFYHPTDETGGYYWHMGTVPGAIQIQSGDTLYVLTSGGAVWKWVYSTGGPPYTAEFVELDGPSNIVAMSNPGETHMLLRSSDNYVWVTGSSRHGALGKGVEMVQMIDQTTGVPMPGKYMQDAADAVVPFVGWDGSQVQGTKITCALWTSLILVDDEVHVAGLLNYGEGVKDSTDYMMVYPNYYQQNPSTVTAILSTPNPYQGPIDIISGTGLTSWAINPMTGAVEAFGWNSYNQGGKGGADNSAHYVSGGSGIMTAKVKPSNSTVFDFGFGAEFAAAGYWSVYVRNAAGEIYTWGLTTWPRSSPTTLDASFDYEHTLPQEYSINFPVWGQSQTVGWPARAPALDALEYFEVQRIYGGIGVLNGNPMAWGGEWIVGHGDYGEEASEVIEVRQMPELESTTYFTACPRSSNDPTSDRDESDPCLDPTLQTLVSGVNGTPDPVASEALFDYIEQTIGHTLESEFSSQWATAAAGNGPVQITVGVEGNSVHITLDNYEIVVIATEATCVGDGGPNAPPPTPPPDPNEPDEPPDPNAPPPPPPPPEGGGGPTPDPPPTPDPENPNAPRPTPPPEPPFPPNPDPPDPPDPNAPPPPDPPDPTVPPDPPYPVPPPDPNAPNPPFPPTPPAPFPPDPFGGPLPPGYTAPWLPPNGTFPTGPNMFPTPTFQVPTPPDFDGEPPFLPGDPAFPEFPDPEYPGYPEAPGWDGNIGHIDLPDWGFDPCFDMGDGGFDFDPCGPGGDGGGAGSGGGGSAPGDGTGIIPDPYVDPGDIEVEVDPPYEADARFNTKWCKIDYPVMDAITELCALVGMEVENVVFEEDCDKVFTKCFEKDTKIFDAIWWLADYCGFQTFDPGDGGVEITPVTPLDVVWIHNEYVDLVEFSRDYDNIDVFPGVEVFRMESIRRGRVAVPEFSWYEPVQTVFDVSGKDPLRIEAPENWTNQQCIDKAKAEAAMMRTGLTVTVATPLNTQARYRHQILVQKPSKSYYALFMITNTIHSINNSEGNLSIHQCKWISAADETVSFQMGINVGPRGLPATLVGSTPSPVQTRRPSKMGVGRMK